MEIVHEVVVRFQIVVDKRGTAGGTNNSIQSPVGVRVLVGFHFVAKVALQIGFRIGGEVRSLFLQLVGQLGQEEGRLRLGLFQHIEVVNVPHMGNFTQHLVSEGGEHPPCPAFLLPEHGQQLFAVGRDTETVLAQFLQPDLHILPGDFPAIIGAQADVPNRLAAHQDIPVLQHLFGGVFLEVNQFKQLDLVPLRGEDQFVLLAVEPHFKTNLVKCQIQDVFAFLDQFTAMLMVLILIHDLAQLGFLLGKLLPRRFRPFPETLTKLRHGDALFTPVDQLLGILVIGASFQGLFKVSQSPAFLIQIKVGITHAEVPVIVVLEVFLMGF